MSSTDKDDARIVNPDDLVADREAETKWTCPLCAGKCQACEGSQMLSPGDYKAWSAALKRHRCAVKP